MRRLRSVTHTGPARHWRLTSTRANRSSSPDHSRVPLTRKPDGEWFNARDLGRGADNGSDTTVISCQSRLEQNRATRPLFLRAACLSGTNRMHCIGGVGTLPNFCSLFILRPPVDPTPLFSYGGLRKLLLCYILNPLPSPAL
jgi:hypothetical protein